MSDDPTPARPWEPASLVLAAGLAAVFAAQLAFGGWTDPVLVRMGAQYPRALADGAWWTLAASSLLHVGWFHLAMNACFVLVVGSRIERIVGPWRMLTVFFAGGLGGSLLSELATPNLVSAGASGGAWGLLAAELLLIASPILRGGRRPGSTLRRTGLLVAVNAALSLAPGVHGLAHLGGGVFGGAALLASHFARRTARVAAALAALHAVGLSVAWWVGEPWRLDRPLAPDLHRPVIGGLATASVPGDLQVRDQRLTTVVGRAWLDPVSVTYDLERTNESWCWGGAPARIDCGPGCSVRRRETDDGTQYCAVQTFGPFALVTTALVPDGSASGRAWADANVGRLALTDAGVDRLFGLAWPERMAGDIDGEIALLEALARVRPNQLPIVNSLAWRLATSPSTPRDGARALELARGVVAAAPDDWNYLDTLAAAYAETGDFARAVATQEASLARAPDSKVREARTHLDALQAGQPIRDP